ncbi:MAG: hypothetical protein V6Z78_03535 [Holosporaceae bacterium]
MSSSADGAQADPKVDSDKAPAGKSPAASGVVKPVSSHAQPASSSHYSGSNPVAVVKPTTHSGSHSIGVGSSTSHTSRSKTSRELLSGGESGNESDYDSRSSGVSSKSDPKAKLSRAQRDAQREESRQRALDDAGRVTGAERQGSGVQTDISIDPNQESEIDFTKQS